jgi:hypothetical protein
MDQNRYIKWKFLISATVLAVVLVIVAIESLLD